MCRQGKRILGVFLMRALKSPFHKILIIQSAIKTIANNQIKQIKMIFFSVRKKANIITVYDKRF